MMLQHGYFFDDAAVAASVLHECLAVDEEFRGSFSESIV